MEQVIRRFPDQYFWMHNRWKTYGRDMGGAAAR
jgi:lauroyl/myristoyl acyltransferase